MAVAVWVGRPPAADRLVAEAVTDHLRLLARADALDVRSGDVHQLRPWLTSRLDFAPVIPFAGDAEFPLRGGTTEYFLDRRAAAAVYGRRLHAITLLVVGRIDDLAWPAPGRPLTTSMRGFNVRLWQVGRARLRARLRRGRRGARAARRPPRRLALDGACRARVRVVVSW